MVAAREGERTTLLLYGGSAEDRGGHDEGQGKALGDLWALTLGDAELAAGGGGTWRLLSDVPPESDEERYGAVESRSRDPELVVPPAAARHVPPARASHGAAVHYEGECCRVAGCMLLFGGLGARHAPLSDLWEYVEITL